MQGLHFPRYLAYGFGVPLLIILLCVVLDESNYIKDFSMQYGQYLWYQQKNGNIFENWFTICWFLVNGQGNLACAGSMTVQPLWCSSVLRCFLSASPTSSCMSSLCPALITSLLWHRWFISLVLSFLNNIIILSQTSMETGVDQIFSFTSGPHIQYTISNTILIVRIFVILGITWVFGIIGIMGTSEDMFPLSQWLIFEYMQ